MAPSWRLLLSQLAAIGVGLAAAPRCVETIVKPPLPDGADDRSLTTAFPRKDKVIPQHTRPPLFEAQFEVFDRGRWPRRLHCDIASRRVPLGFGSPYGLALPRLRCSPLLVNKIRRKGPTDFSTSLCFCGPTHRTAGMRLSGSDH
jgi:hypothetical protein